MPEANEVDDSARRLKDLIGRIVVRDESALADLYDLTSAQVHGLILRIVSRPETAEEVTHDVYLQIWRQAGKYDPCRGRPLTWILLLARSRALDRIRGKGRLERAESLEAGAAVADSAPTPDQGTNEEDCRRRIEPALGRLTPAQREAIACAYFRGLSYSETAEVLGEPVGTVKTRIRLGLTRLREMLQPLRGER